MAVSLYKIIFEWRLNLIPNWLIVLIDYIDGQGEINLSISDPFHVLFVKKKKEKPVFWL
jgi:hypothetical protein